MKKEIFFLLGMCLFAAYSMAQTCSGTWGPPIVDQTFGQGQAGTQFYSPLSTYAPGVTTSTTFVTSGPGDNYSCLTDNASNGQPGSWVNVTDHTGNPYGLMLEINAPSSGGTIFVQYTMHDLCPNTTLQLGVWVLNVDGGDSADGRQYPNMTMEVVDSVTGLILDSVETGDVPFDAVWHQYTMVFNNGNSTTLILKFINNSVGSGDGNDLALDDITVSPCVPLANVLPEVDTAVCTGTNISFTANIVGNVYNPAEYQWQYSADMGATWTDAFPASATAAYNFTGSTPGTYWVRFLAGPMGFSENSNCSAVSDTSIITVNPFPLPPAITGDTLYCPGGTVAPFVVAGQNILWFLSDSGGAGSATQPVINTSQPGTYTLYVSQTVNGCESGRDSISVLVGGGAAIDPYISSTQPNSCFVCDGTVTLHGVVPGYTDTVSYQFNNVSQSLIATAVNDSTITIAGLCPGIYASFEIKEQQCIANIPGPVSLAVTPPVVSIVQIIDPTACGICDGTIVLKGLPPGQEDVVNYTFNGNSRSVSIISAADSTITLNNLCQGDYNDISVQTGLCTSTPIGPVSLSSPPLTPAFTYIIHYGCDEDTVTFTNTSQYTGSVYYRWDFGDHAFDTITSPTHIYTHQDTFYVTLFIGNFHCADSVTDTIPLVHPIAPGFTTSPDTICQGQTITFYNTSVGTRPVYFWDFGDGFGSIVQDTTSHTFMTAGVYQVKLEENDFVPCFDTAYKTVFVDSMSAVDFTMSDSVLCAGKQITFTGNYSDIGNIGDVWNFGDGSSIINTNPVDHAYETAGTMSITLTAKYRVCPDTSITKQVLINPYPLLDLGPDTSMCPNAQPISLNDLINANNPQAHWLWSTGDTSSGILVGKPDVYYTTVTINGCSTSDSVWVKNDCYINIPNAFTPNNDGVNDYFFPRQMLTSGATEFSMGIYNRWGEEIFKTNNTGGRGWDGKFNDVLQPEGVYIYVIDIAFKDGQKEHFQGNVTLLK